MGVAFVLLSRRRHIWGSWQLWQILILLLFIFDLTTPQGDSVFPFFSASSSPALKKKYFYKNTQPGYHSKLCVNKLVLYHFWGKRQVVHFFVHIRHETRCQADQKGPKVGPKGHQLEVGAWRAPRLQVQDICYLRLSSVTLRSAALFLVHVGPD